MVSDMALFTPAQRLAIEGRGGTMLVSAGAGSGKTRVLVERIIERITNADDPCDVDELLVVTFTRAAAGEMKERIAKRLTEMIAQNPENTHLQRQLILLEKAHISTVHSFCQSIVREYFHVLGISPDFRLGDDSEMAVLRRQAVEEVLEELYAIEDNAGFVALADSINTGRDDSQLAAVILTLYDYVRSHPFPKRWLDEKLALFDDSLSPEDSLWGKAALAYALDVVRFYAAQADALEEEMREHEALYEKHGVALVKAAGDLRLICGAIEMGDWEGVIDLFESFEFERTSAPRGYGEDPLNLKFKDLKDAVSKEIGGLRELFCRQDEFAFDMRTLYPLVKALFEAVKLLLDKLEEKKLARRILDFGDLEHYAIKLLIRETDKGFERTDYALEIGKGYKEVLVDEYQDTNEAQDTIFWAVSQNEENLFMVGDAKQSIYRFRLAMPEIFIERRDRYENFRGDNYPCRLTLGANFRSRKGVLSAVNFVMRYIMSKEMGEIDYNEEEEMAFAAPFSEDDSPCMRFELIDLKDTREQELLEDKEDIEANRVAAIIREMMDSGFEISENGERRPAKYSDFVVLLRSFNLYSEAYVKAMARMGIPSVAQGAGSFFGAAEVSTMLSLLEVIDNPLQDVPLLAVMMSPLFGFTPDELAEIRLSNEGEMLYRAVAFCAGQGMDKCAQFLKDIERFRALAGTMPCDALIRRVCDETGYYSVVQGMPFGEQRIANLRLLEDYAMRFERTGKGGLSGFLRFIDRLKRQKGDLQAAEVHSQHADVVRVMSVHNSKGKEFPVCILAGCGRQFNMVDLRSPVLLHPEMGIGMMRYDPKTDARYSTLPREALALEIERANISEEMRVLYVAMTRAKEKLIVAATLSDLEKAVKRLANKLQGGNKLSPYAVRRAKGYYEWLIMAALRHPDGGELRGIAGVGEDVVIPCEDRWEINIVNATELQGGEAVMESGPAVSPDEGLMEELRARLEFVYPHKGALSVPAKVSASQLSGKELNFEFFAKKRPSFMEEGALTGAERGTALHKFMQFVDFGGTESLEQELGRLVARGFLTQAEGEAVNLKKVERFFESRLFERIMSAQEYYREKRFNVFVPASMLEDGAGEDNVVLQGVVDCVFREDGGLVIVDYKTDWVERESVLVERYGKQLDLYAFAMERCFGLPVREKIIYSFHLDREVAL